MPPRKVSRLCKQLPEILKDTSSLSMLEYFIQYMESVKALHLVQFWLTVESFKAQGRSPPKGSDAGTPNSHSQPGTPKGPGHSQPGTPKGPGHWSPKGSSQDGGLPSCHLHHPVSSPSSSEPHVLPADEAQTCSQPGTPKTPSQQQQQHSPATTAVAAAQQQQSHSHPGSPEVGQFGYRPTMSSLVASSSSSSLSEPNFNAREGGSSAEDDKFRQRASSGGSVHIRGLRRRDTENHKYCNCGIGGHHRTSSTSISSTEEQTPPLPLKVDSIMAPNKLANGDDHTRLKHGHHHHLDHTPHSVESGLYNMTPKGLPLHKGAENLVPNYVSSQPHSTKIILEKDALEIYSKYLALNALKPVGATDEIRQKVEVSICPEDGVVSSSCFSEAQQFVYETMERRYYPGFLHSSFLCKYQLEYVSSGSLCLLDFLLGENALSFFIEFMEQENASPLLQFWLTAENFYIELSSPEHVANAEADMVDAIAIYNRYFSLQATAPLHMEDRVRVDVENRICDKHGPRADSYLRPQLVAYHTINEVHFPVFVGSSIYLRFLNGLIQMLNKDEGSTLQGDGSSKMELSKKHTESTLKLSHVITGRDLDDPNSLWERPALLFRLGFVNDFGEYISEVDPIPVKSSKRENSWTVSARALRKHRKQEDLAMKIAKNIIWEVTNSNNCTADKDLTTAQEQPISIT